MKVFKNIAQHLGRRPYMLVLNINISNLTAPMPTMNNGGSAQLCQHSELWIPNHRLALVHSVGLPPLWGAGTQAYLRRTTCALTTAHTQEVKMCVCMRADIQWCTFMHAYLLPGRWWNYPLYFSKTEFVNLILNIGWVKLIIIKTFWFSLFPESIILHLLCYTLNVVLSLWRNVHTGFTCIPTDGLFWINWAEQINCTDKRG